MILLLYLTSAFDAEMSREEKKKTGIHKLSQQEQSSLQTWIDNYYTKRAVPLQSPPETRSLLQENLINGRSIGLANGTLWHIAPQDTPLTQSWITPVDIVVSANDDPDYPYKLTNSLTGTTVHAKKASK